MIRRVHLLSSRQEWNADGAAVRTPIYEFVNLCDAAKNNEKQGGTIRQEWSELLGSLDWNEFTR